jgi:hypothetical protein
MTISAERVKLEHLLSIFSCLGHVTDFGPRLRCVNQADLQERSSQVSIMKDIYNKASGVVVWLGESTTHLSATIECISVISKRFQADTLRSPETIVGSSGLQLSAADVEHLKSYNDITPDAYDSVARLFSLPYFRRVW